jgi:hypothetical protein
VDPGEKGAILETGGPGPPGGEKAGSWLQTVEEKRHSKMAKDGTGSPNLQETVMHRVSALCIVQ